MTDLYRATFVITMTRIVIKCLLILLGMLVVLGSKPLLASVIVFYDFDQDGEFYNGPAFAAPEVENASAWSSTGTLEDYAGVEGRAVAHRGDNTFSFTLELQPGWAVELESLDFWARRSSSGSPAWQASINDVAVTGDDALSADDDGYFYDSLSLLSPDLGPQEGVIAFDIETMGADSALGTFRIDNFSLEGTVSAIPEPRWYAASLGLIAAAFVWLRHRRRKPDSRAELADPSGG